MARGLSEKTPAVAVERGTTPEQRAVWSSLGELAREVEKAGLSSPTLIVIGEVVSLAPGWKAAVCGCDAWDVNDSTKSSGGSFREWDMPGSALPEQNSDGSKFDGASSSGKVE